MKRMFTDEDEAILRKVTNSPDLSLNEVWLMLGALGLRPQANGKIRRWAFRNWQTLTKNESEFEPFLVWEGLVRRGYGWSEDCGENSTYTVFHVTRKGVAEISEQIKRRIPTKAGLLWL